MIILKTWLVIIAARRVKDNKAVDIVDTLSWAALRMLYYVIILLGTTAHAHNCITKFVSISTRR